MSTTQDTKFYTFAEICTDSYISHPAQSGSLLHAPMAWAMMTGWQWLPPSRQWKRQGYHGGINNGTMATESTDW